MESREVYYEIEERIGLPGVAPFWTNLDPGIRPIYRSECEEDVRERLYELRKQGRDVRMVEVIREVVEPEGNHYAG